MCDGVLFRDGERVYRDVWGTGEYCRGVGEGVSGWGRGWREVCGGRGIVVLGVKFRGWQGVGRSVCGTEKRFSGGGV